MLEQAVPGYAPWQHARINCVPSQTSHPDTRADYIHHILTDLMLASECIFPATHTALLLDLGTNVVTPDLLQEMLGQTSMHRQLLSQPANLHDRNCAVPHGWPSCAPPQGLPLRGSEWGVAPHLSCVHQPGKPGERGSQERALSSNRSIQKEEAPLK